MKDLFANRFKEQPKPVEVKHRSIQSTVYPENRPSFNEWSMFIKKEVLSNTIRTGGLYYREQRERLLGKFKRILAGRS